MLKESRINSGLFFLTDICRSSTKTYLMDIEVKKETAPVKKNFDFVDTIRCISMFGIVFEHSAVLWGTKYSTIGDTLLQVITMQFWKFATIAFFLIGGFLINYKFTEYTPA